MVTREQTQKQQKLEKKNGEKYLQGYYKPQTFDITQEMTWTWLNNGNLKRETESLLIA